MARRFTGALVAAAGLWAASAAIAEDQIVDGASAGPGGATHGWSPTWLYALGGGLEAGGKMPGGAPPPAPPAAPAAPGAAAPAAPAAPGEAPAAPTPPEAAPSTAAEAMAAAESFAPAEGGALGGAGGTFNMLGDQAPVFGRPRPPNPPHVPGRPTGVTGILAQKGGTTLPWIRGFKIADNQSPVPQDRVFFNFNYYNNINYAIDRKFNAPVSGIQIYRYLGGVEKTFLDGLASVGLTESINNLSAVSGVPSLAGTHTAMGDLTLFSKLVLYQAFDDPRAMNALGGFGYPAQVPGGRNGGLISAGLAITAPTGPGGFAGAGFSKSFRTAFIQPFLGYFYSRGNFYLQGFEAIDVPTDPNDVTMIYNDIGMGYYVYRNPNMDTFISAFAPTFEVHANVPLNHTDINNVLDPVATKTIVDLTLGGNIQFGQRTVLLLGAVTPVSGPRPFAIEGVALLNFYFGGRQNRPNLPTYPMAGQ
jgi:hypothetical protein